MKKILFIVFLFFIQFTFGQTETVTNNIDQDIPDLASPNVGGFSVVTFSSLPVGSIITNVSYDLGLNHSYNGDLSARISDNFDGESGLSEVILSSNINNNNNSGFFNVTGNTDLFNDLDPNLDIYVRVWDNFTDYTGFIDYFSVTITYTAPSVPLVSHVTPPLSSPVILGETITFTVHGINLTNQTAYHLPDFGDGIVNSDSSTTQKTFTVTSSNNVGIKHGEIKEQLGGDILKTFDINVYFPTPTNLTAATQSNSQINLNWNAVSNTFQYKVYRSNSLNGTYIFKANRTSTNYQDRGLNSNTTYYYKIQACQASNQNSCSSQSNPVNAITNGNTDFLNVTPTNVTQNSNNGSQNISVTSNISWTVSESLSWLSTSISSGSNNSSFNIIFNENTSANSRNGIVTVQGSGITRQISVTQSGVSNVSPNPATFVSVPIELNINESFNFVFQSGTDPNGDLVRVKITATNSDLNPNPFLTNLQNGGQQFTKSISFSQIGNQTVTIQTIDSNGNGSSVVNRNINIVDTSPINEVTIGNITFTASNIVELSTNRFELSGNVNVQNFIHFTGNVIVDVGLLKVEGNGSIYMSNINGSNLNLYNGEFNYSVNSTILSDTLLQDANELFTMAGLPLNINNINILSNGVNIDGSLKLPEIFGVINAEISNVTITQTNGIQFGGFIALEELRLTDSDDFTVSGNLTFNTNQNEFSGLVNLQTPQFGIEASLALRNGSLDSISINYTSSTGIILGSTGLKMTEIGGSVVNIQPPHPPNTSVTLGMSLAPVIASNFFELSDVYLTYIFDTSLEGHGTFKILGEEMTSANFKVQNDFFKISGNANFYDIVFGEINLAIVDITSGIGVAGNFEATLQIPDNTTTNLLRALKALPNIQLPYEIANTQNFLNNNELNGQTTINIPDLPLPLTFGYKLVWLNNQLDADYWSNWRDFVPTLRSSQTENLLYKNHLYSFNERTNSFKDISLIVKPIDYNIDRSQNQSLNIDFVLPNNTSNLIVTVKPENESGNYPNYSLINPNDEEINAGNIDSFDNVIYTQSNILKEGFYTIVNAQQGAWHIQIEDDGQNYLVDLDGIKDRGIAIDTLTKVDNNVTVTWVDNDPDFDNQISLYYDFDNEGFDGTIITTGISEDDPTNAYTFDVSNLQTGQYYVYAIMYDEDGVPVKHYSQEFFTIGSNIQAPANLTKNINADDSITFNWTKLDETDNFDYIIYYQQDGEVTYSSLNLNAGNTDTLTIYDFDQQPIYQFMVVAQDVNNNLSEKSNVVTVDLAKNQTHNFDAGWNLISFNIEPFNLSIEEVIAPISNNLLEVRNETQSYDPNINPDLNTLHTIENGKGYWIKLVQTEQLNTRGKTIHLDNLSINLNQGWNLIAYPKADTQDVAIALSSISSFIIEVRNATQSYDPNINPDLNTLHQLTPNEGYWIKVNQNCTLTF